MKLVPNVADQAHHGCSTKGGMLAHALSALGVVITIRSAHIWRNKPRARLSDAGGIPPARRHMSKASHQVRSRGNTDDAATIQNRHGIDCSIGHQGQ